MHPWLIFALATVIACAKATSPVGEDDAATQPQLDAPTTPTDAAIDANNCSVQPCSILPQCGCSGANACDLDSTDNMGTVCRPIMAPGTETSTCTSLQGCDKGFVCLGGATSAACKRYCTANADCGTPRGRCAIDITSGGTPISGIPPACSSNCNPLPTTQPAECPTGYKCGLFTATHNAAPVKIADCSPAGAGTQGANCKVGNAGSDTMCATGFLCTTVDAGTTYTCRRMCNKTANTGCVGAQTCIGFQTPHTIDIEYGVCN